MNVIISNKYQALLGVLDIEVIKSINGVFSVEEIVSQFSNFFFNKMIIDITAIEDYENTRMIQELSMNLDMSKVILLLDDSEIVNSPMYLSQLVSMGIYNFTRKVDVIKFLIDNPNSYKDVANYQQLSASSSVNFNSKLEKQETKGFIGQRILGIKNVTEHAGATTLTYLFKKHIEKFYQVKAVELDANDFVFFNDKELESINSNNLSNYISSNSEVEVILVDLNNNEDNFCTEVIYLIEPGLIKLNKLIKKDNKIFGKLKGKKIILNRSVLNDKDIEDFEKESASKVYYNLPNVDDKLDETTDVINLLISLGFTRFTEENEEKGIFGIF